MANSLKKSEDRLSKYSPEDQERFRDIQEYIINNFPDQKKKKNKFPEELKIFAKTLVLKGYQYSQVADILGVGRTTVIDWMNDPYIDQLCNNDLAESVKTRMASDLIIKSQIAFNAAMTPEKIEKSSTLQLASAGGIMFDKARLLKGESTQNIATANTRINEFHSDIDEKESDILKLEAEIAMLDDED